MKTRELTLKILVAISKGGYSNLLLDRYLKGLKDARDRALITEMVYGVLRLKNRLDYIIKDFSRLAINKMEPVVIQALRMGVYQLLFLDRVPDRAAVYETVEAVKAFSNKGAAGFVNAVLRNISRNKEQISYPDPLKDQKSYLSDYLSHPQWLVDYWLKIYGFEKTRDLCEYNNQPGELVIRINSLKVKEEDFLQIYKKAGFDLWPTWLPQSYLVLDNRGVERLPLYKEGAFFVQGLAAALVGYIMNPLPGMRILDMAAAPGGKSTHLAELMGNQGEIIALDIHEHKLKLINDNCKRLGVEIVKTLKCDSRYFKSEEKFDMILLDAPCSGLGLIKQKPEIRWNKSMADIKKMTALQLEMLENALSLLKDGGILLYSTCTLTREENQNNIARILELYPDIIGIEDIQEDLNRLALKGILEADDNGLLEIFPPDSQSEGFFIAKLKKF